MTKFMVQWEDHPSHLATRLGALLEHQKLVDVTLMCNTHTLRVHRAVLAAGSPYFEGILMRNLGQHPLIVLKDMQFSVLKSLIEFMYCGETSVTEENLPALLQAAKFFQVRGLSAMTKEALGLPAESANSVNGAPNPSVSIGTHKAFVRPQKRVNIQSVKTTKPLAAAAAAAGAVGPGGAAFHTVPKTIAAKATQDTQAANAQLLLSLSEVGKPRKAAGGATPPNLLKKAAAPIGAQAHQRYKPAQASAGQRGFKQEAAPAPAQPQHNKPQHSNILGNKKRPRPVKPSPEKAAPAPAAPHQDTTLYQDPETNIIYQIEAQQPAAAAEDNVIYQLPDGTISDQHGNPLLDKDGNTQNIMHYQLPEAQAGFEMSDGQFVLGGDSEADMPILLDNGDGNFVTVHEDALKNMAASGFTEEGVAYTTNDKGEYVVFKGAAQDKPVMSVEEALEEMMADDKEEHADAGITVEAGAEADSTMLEPSAEYEASMAADGSNMAADGSSMGADGSNVAAEGGYLEEAAGKDQAAGAEYLEGAGPGFIGPDDGDPEAYLQAAETLADDAHYHQAGPDDADMGGSYLEAEPGFVEAETVEAMMEGDPAFSAGAAPDEPPPPDAGPAPSNGVGAETAASSLLKIALTAGQTGAPTSAEPRDTDGSIPFAVGLLPLQDALLKFQDMPEHTPRKTRSSDDPAARTKRKGSSNSDGGGGGGSESKRILLTEDWKISEDELSATEASG